MTSHTRHPIPARRAKRPSADERREAILREGMRCFAARGFSGTTTREVAAGVGITEAALYRYYPSKESLYSAIVARKIDTPPLVDRLAEDAARRDDVAVFRGIARGILERGRAIRSSSGSYSSRRSSHTSSRRRCSPRTWVRCASS